MASNVLSEVLRKLVQRSDLSADETEAAFFEIMEGRASDAQKAALLVGLRVKGERPQEVAGGVRALRRAMIPVPIDGADSAVDTCGTGGGSLTTFNVSTAAAFVVAGAGVPVAKHGNRSFRSKCGSADVLEALGVRIDLTPDAMAETFRRVGMTFLFAPTLHPAMKHLAPVRRELGIPTVMNLLGPLTNPAGVRRQVVGVADPGLLDLVGEALLALGHIRALVAHGAPGMDEMSPLGVTTVVEVSNGSLRRYHLDAPAAFRWSDLRAEDLAGGSPQENARRIEGVLMGKIRGAARLAVCLNAGAALYAAERVASIEEGVAMAERSLDAGAGYGVLTSLRKVASELAVPRTERTGS